MSARKRGSERKRHSEPGGDIAIRALLASVVVGSALALGSVHVVTILVMAALTTLATALVLRRGYAQNWREILRSPIGLGLGLAAFTMFQAVPLPMAWIRRIAPSNADVWSRSLLPFDEPGPNWASISLDPGASIVETLKWLTYTGVFACAMVLARRGGRTWGVTLVFTSGVVTAVVTVGHGLAGASAVYGLYKPHFIPAPWHIGPLLNPNNLAGYLNLAAMCGLGLLLSRQTVTPRWLVALGITIVGAVVVIAASRGGFIALLLGVLLFGLVLVIGTKESSGSRLPRGTAALLFLGAISGGALFAVLGSTRETWSELYDKNLLKLRMLAWAKPLIADHPWFGIGRGAFESVFPAYRIYSEHLVFTHAENFPAQWIAEWGLPVALLALVGFTWCLRPAAIGVRRSILAAGVAVGIGVLLLQNLFDLGLEVPSICIALAASFGTIWGGWGHSSKLARLAIDAPGAHGYGGWMVVGGVALLIALTVFPFHGLHEVAQDREDLHQSFQVWLPTRTSNRADDLRRDLHVAMQLHPAEPYFPLLAAEVAWLGGTRDNPMRALSRSLERASQNGRAHLLLAEILTTRGARSQARLELRLAVVDEPALAPAAARLEVNTGATIEELLETVPEGQAGLALLDALYWNVQEEKKILLVQELLRRDPQNLSAHSHLAEHYLIELGRGDASLVCAGEAKSGCETEFARSVSTMARSRPSSSVPDQYRARLLLINGKAEQAESLLAARCRDVDDVASCQFQRASMAAAVRGNPEVLHVAARELQRVACSSAKECAGTATTIGDMFGARGEWGTALTYYKRACKDDPDESRWSRLADAAARVGSHAQAADALEKVAQLRGRSTDAALRARIEVERGRALGIIPE